MTMKARRCRARSDGHRLTGQGSALSLGYELIGAQLSVVPVWNAVEVVAIIACEMLLIVWHHRTVSMLRCLKHDQASSLIWPLVPA